MARDQASGREGFNHARALSQDGGLGVEAETERLSAEAAGDSVPSLPPSPPSFPSVLAPPTHDALERIAVLSNRHSAWSEVFRSPTRSVSCPISCQNRTL
jgi:hypothetical protein